MGSIGKLFRFIIWLFPFMLGSASNVFAQSRSDYNDHKPAAGMIPAATLQTILEQNKLLREQGRSVNWYGKQASRNSASCGSCRDMGAENGWDLWLAEQGPNYDSLGLQLSLLTTPASPRFSINTGPGIDPLTPGVNPGDPPITLIAPPGFGSSSIFLGERQNDGIGGLCMTQQSQIAAGCAERLTYCFTVGIQDTNFVYAYAFVMENPGDNSHTLQSMPYVEFMILDANGDTLPCAYQRYIASESFPGQYTCNSPRFGSNGGGGGNFRDTALYKPWTVEGVNLSSYIGQTLTVVITNADCQLGGHFAHSYWDFACGSQSAVVKPSCYTNAPDTLSAPASPDTLNTYGYEWYLNNDPVPIGYTQVITPYSQNGDTFTVKVITPSGCNWYARYVPQHFSVTTDYSFQTSCGFASFQSNSFSPSTEDPISYWSWNFPGGTPSSADTSHPGPVVFSPGNHTVTLISGTYSPGCRDTMQYVVNVPQLPVASFSANDVCAGENVTFSNTSTIPAGDTIATYQWSFPGGFPSVSSAENPVVSYPDPGQSRVTLIVTSSDGCKDTIRQTITIHPRPVASFTAPAICLGQSVQLSNTSYIASLTETISYSWDIPGALPANPAQQSPVIGFVVPDTFIATLIVTSGFGCADTAVQSIIVHPKPYADFTAPRFCAGRSGILDENSILSFGEQIVSFRWTLPGGIPASSTQSDPAITYALPDTFNATLVVTNNFGCKDTAVHPVIISANPFASFTAQSICLGQPLQLQNTSTIVPAGDSMLFSWTLPGATPSQSSLFEPAVSFSSPLTTSITLVVTASGGCADTAVRTISVHPYPRAAFLATDACVGAPLSFLNQSTSVPGDTIISNVWSFPGGSPSTSSGSNPSVVFNNPDTVDVRLVVTNPGGCRDTAVRTVRITPSPTALFSANSHCLGTRPAIQNSSFIRPAGSAMYYQWDFDGAVPSNSNDRDPVVDYPLPGSSLIRLIVSAEGGCADTADQIIQIFPLPVADFSAPLACFGQPVTFDNISQAFPGDTLAGYSWNFPFGNPSVSQLTDPTVSFGSVDTSSVRLVATSIHGCRDTIIRPVIIAADPLAAFTLPDICAEGIATVVNTSTVQPNGSAVTYSWTAPGASPSFSTDMAPSFAYPDSGVYPVELIVKSTGGCADTLIRSVLVHPLPAAGFNALPSCVGQEVSIVNTSNASSSEPIESYQWLIPGAVPALSTVRNPSVRFDSSGTFSASLTVTTRNGCKDTVQGPLIIHALPQVLLPDLDSACAPFCHSFQNQSASSDGSITQWSWNFPGGQPAVSTLENPGLVCYDTPGQFDVALQIQSEFGCVSDTLVTGIIEAYPLPEADFTVSSSVTGILDPDFTFTDASSSDVVQWLWNFGDGSPSVLGGPLQIHSYAGSMVGNTFYRYEASLIVTTRNGCTDTVFRPLDITPDFTFYIPSAFTPNDDRKNNLFYAKSFGVKEYDIWIFDRWGLEIWSCHYEGDNNPWDLYGEEGMSSACRWDGSYKGKTVQQDVYVWKALLTDVFGKKHAYIGHVSVIY